MDWKDQDGRLRPIDDVFAAHLGQVRRRLGGMVSNRLQRRKRHSDRAGDRPVLHVRTAEGTRVYLDQDVPPKAAA